MKQYKVINVKTQKTIGYIVGKTLDNELVLDTGKGTKRLKITPKNEALYSVIIEQITA